MSENGALDLMAYWKCQAEKREAYQRYNYAGAALELAEIRERMAEFESQWEPKHSLAELPIKDAMHAAIQFVVLGRKPKEPSNEE